MRKYERGKGGTRKEVIVGCTVYTHIHVCTHVLLPSRCDSSDGLKGRGQGVG